MGMRIEKRPSASATVPKLVLATRTVAPGTDSPPAVTWPATWPQFWAWTLGSSRRLAAHRAARKEEDRIRA